MERPDTAGIMPVKIGPESKFNFLCHKGISCFTECCRDINITLTPYDIILLKNKLGLSSEEFLAIYTEPHILEKTDLPVVTLKQLDDERKSCPFVRDDGCIVYSDRPTVCRYYPLGVASLSHKEGADDEEFYFFVNEPHCLGFEEETQWTAKDWRRDQGVDIHDTVNAGWTDLIVKKRSFPKNIQLNEKSKSMFFMVSYNLDQFKKFVFETSFLKRYDIEEETVSLIRKDEVALLDFGMKWLSSIFFQGEKLKVRQKEE